MPLDDTAADDDTTTTPPPPPAPWIPTHLRAPLVDVPGHCTGEAAIAIMRAKWLAKQFPPPHRRGERTAPTSP